MITEIRLITFRQISTNTSRKSIQKKLWSPYPDFIEPLWIWEREERFSSLEFFDSFSYPLNFPKNFILRKNALSRWTLYRKMGDSSILSKRQCLFGAGSKPFLFRLAVNIIVPVSRMTENHDFTHEKLFFEFDTRVISILEFI